MFLLDVNFEFEGYNQSSFIKYLVASVHICIFVDFIFGVSTHAFSAKMCCSFLGHLSFFFCVWHYNLVVGVGLPFYFNYSGRILYLPSYTPNFGISCVYGHCDLKNMRAIYINHFFYSLCSYQSCYYAFLLPLLCGFSFIWNNL